ncbi:MAG: hypothetical protein JWQ66_163 [Mucilaginibacter sp.]|nr:hypothetical protein [Mucilaginibacter sp.]
MGRSFIVWFDMIGNATFSLPNPQFKPNAEISLFGPAKSLPKGSVDENIIRDFYT